MVILVVVKNEFEVVGIRGEMMTSDSPSKVAVTLKRLHVLEMGGGVSS